MAKNMQDDWQYCPTCGGSCYEVVEVAARRTLKDGTVEHFTHKTTVECKTCGGAGQVRK